MHQRTLQKLCSNSWWKKKVSMLSHCAYSSNLSPPEYFAFFKLKIELKGDQYKNILEIQKSAMAKLKTILIHE